jgi:hypothetical protein
MNLVRIPLAPRGKNPLVFGWQNEPADSPVWGAAARNVPDCNWGLRLDDLVVADCDSPEAVEFWVRECPIATPVQLVGNWDRKAFWYRRPANTLLRTFRIRPDIEIRTGPGAQQAIPPSIHPHEPGKRCRGPEGHRYEWEGIDGHLLEQILLPMCPEAPEEWILAQKPSVASWGDGNDGWDVIPEGGRNVALTAIGGLLRRHGASETAIERGLDAYNDLFCRPRLTEEELGKISWSVARYRPETGTGGGITIEVSFEDE